MAKIKLKDVCSYVKGASIPRDRTSPDFDIPYLHYGDIYKKYNGRLNLDTAQKTIIKVSKNEKISDEQLILDKDIVYTLTSETIEDLGHCTIVYNKKNKPIISGMETTLIHVNNRDIVNPEYLNYIFQSSKFKSLLHQFVTGMKVYRVHPRDLMSISIDFPSIHNQNSIVNMLNLLSDEIDVNQQINDYLSYQSIN